LGKIVKERDIPKELGEAIEYALLGGGKRIRPFLFLQAFSLFCDREKEIIPFACGIEAIHSYSLVHDDLPVMDDDDYRRGRLTTHKVFGEANALLVGDALLTLGCELMGSVARKFPPALVGEAQQKVIKASGPEGMVGGQYLDLAAEGKELTLEELEEIHRRKTGALIQAALVGGAILGGGDSVAVKSLELYGQELGLLFQITDDLLDVEGDPLITGKSSQKDEVLEKATYPRILGVKATREKAISHCYAAQKALNDLGDRANILKNLAEYVYYRDR